MTDVRIVRPLPWAHDDGGRAATGRIGDAGDCVTRALTIATGRPYGEVYDELAAGMKALGKARSARNGVARKVYEPWLFDHGWLWSAHMSIGSGCTVHLADGEVPVGMPVVCRLSGHLAAVVGGVVRDTHDPTRGGTRCVYGWYEPGAGAVVR